MSSSSETCPFCGKNYKRLNSHLPRCKMAPVTTTTQRSQTPPGPADLITDKNSKKTSLSSSSSSPSTTSTKSKKASSSSPSPALSPLATTTKRWQWYYRRYIDVRKGGVGGVAMLLAGYCVLGYTWHYPHIKQDRWRKYH